jgi:hypothetical protein
MRIRKIHLLSGIKYRCQAYYLNHTAKHVSLPVSELFFQHNGEHDFQRYDMIVRLLAVENYFGKNDFGFDFYKRMQEGRKGKAWAESAIGIFRQLIKSYEENGYDTHSEILLDQDLHLIDGSHRMAMAMYYQQAEISVKIIQKRQDIFYGIEWFVVNGFLPDECQLLRDKYRELHDYYVQPFVCTLWHPVAAYFDEITEKLKTFGKVTEVNDYSLPALDYKFYTRGIYAVDDIAKWKIEKKLEYMMTEKSDRYSLRTVMLEIESPDFRLKATNHKTLSKRCELIKKLVRTYYKTRVNNYFHDIVLHIGDNFYQNRYIANLFQLPAIDVKGVLEHINEYDYVITKSQADYMPSDFPIHYPLGKDIDIICANKSQYELVKQCVLADAERYKSSYTVRTVVKVDEKGQEYRILIRLEQEGLLAFLFDIQCRTGNYVAPSFEQAMCAERRWGNGYYTPSPAFELLVRLGEIHEYPQKPQHKAYLKAHIEDLDETLCDQYLLFDWHKIVSEENQ